MRYGGKPPATVPRNFLKAVFMIQAIQPHYAGVPVKKIRYADEEGLFMNTEDAIRTQAWKTGRLKIAYESGLTMFVNRGKKNWTVTWREGTLTLPENGYLADLPGHVFAYSALKDGRRVDFLRAPERVYCDGRGTETDFDSLKAARAYLLEYDAERMWLVPAPFEAEETVRLELNPPAQGEKVKVEVIACDRTGTPLRPAQFKQTGTTVEIKTEKGPFKYLIQKKQM